MRASSSSMSLIFGPVMMTTGHGNYDSPVYIAAAKLRCGDQMQVFLKRVELKGVPIKTSVVAGYCPTAIYEAAAKQGADLIVISTRRTDRFAPCTPRQRC